MNRAVIPLLLMALSGCRAVGPDYARPQNALPGSWGEQAGGGALPVAWWSIFNDASLTQLARGRQPGSAARHGAHAAKPRTAGRDRGGADAGSEPGRRLSAPACHLGGQHGSVRQRRRGGLQLLARRIQRHLGAGHVGKLRRASETRAPASPLRRRIGARC